jgi:hypothetical protein
MSGRFGKEIAAADEAIKRRLVTRIVQKIGPDVMQDR